MTHFRGDPYRHLRTARIAGLVLLLALVMLQVAHFAHLQFGRAWTDTAWYRTTLFVVAPSFYLFSRPILQPTVEVTPGWVFSVHAAPALVAWALPGSLALSLAFALGAGYLAWLARSLYALRRDRANFHFELLLLGGGLAVALCVGGLGVPTIRHTVIWSARSM